ncbi:MAG: dehydrogenase, short-chain alcohol dehydrogenase like protein [Planctomycetaceae bacterium]|nr:dehydrogenase, short-chain alcohol dehydrogenase like protein [Planctomycetaceae bacterium]
MDPTASFFSLKGQTAIVTGAGQGIGEGIARRLAAAGATVAVFDLDHAAATRVAVDIGGVALAGNVTSEADIQLALSELRANGPEPSILVNNAGILGPVGPSHELVRSDLERVLQINLIGAFLWSKAVLPGMFAQNFGRIVNIASIAGKEGNPNLLPYSVSKAGMIAMTKSMAKEVATRGDITINSISPAVIHTPMMDTMPQATRDFMVSRVPMGRPGTIAEVAALVHYLASPDASFTTGQCYDISGGRATY